MSISRFQLSIIVTAVAIAFLLINGAWELTIVALAAEIVAIALGVWKLRFSFFGSSITALSDASQVALTFDDGPDPRTTPAVLALLKKHGVRATFFLIASKCETHPDLVRAIVDAGHRIGSHDLTHHWGANFRLTKKMTAEISESCTIIERYTGTPVSLYRPPVGLSNPHLFAALKKLKLTCIGWDGMAWDGGNRFKRAVERLPNLSQRGTILLLHDVEYTRELTPLFLKKLDELIVNLKAETRAFIVL